jgi:putative aldouronate transport system permease protein
MFLLRVGRFLDTGFEQIFLLLNASNRTVGQVFDTYVYEMGILQGRFSYGITVSIFKSVIGLTLVILTDKLAKRLGEDGIL